jgi:hypothetical protein
VGHELAARQQALSRVLALLDHATSAAQPGDQDYSSQG